MPTARKHTVIPGQPGFFHCVSRCVRRAWLCGTDPLSGNNYDHRRDWMLERMRVLTTCFAIDIYAYSFMDNHYHIVFYIDPQRVESWSDKEVIKKWATLWNWRKPDSEPIIPVNVVAETIQLWRQRLGDVSWVMRLLNEPMARIANAEDDVKGHFWESRFKCNPLLDEQGLTTCMVYADLNPIKAGVARTAEQSDYTSIQERIRALAEENAAHGGEIICCEPGDGDSSAREQKISILPVSSSNPELAPSLSLSLRSYIELVEATAENLLSRQDNVSADILVSIGIKPGGWLRAVKDFAVLFKTAVGSEAAFTEFMKLTGRKRLQDASAREMLFF